MMMMMLVGLSYIAHSEGERMNVRTKIYRVHSDTKILIRFQRDSRILSRVTSSVLEYCRKLRNKQFVRSYANINLACSNKT